MKGVWGREGQPLGAGTKYAEDKNLVCTVRPINNGPDDQCSSIRGKPCTTQVGELFYKIDGPHDYNSTKSQCHISHSPIATPGYRNHHINSASSIRLFSHGEFITNFKHSLSRVEKKIQTRNSSGEKTRRMAPRTQSSAKRLESDFSVKTSTKFTRRISAGEILHPTSQQSARSKNS